MNLHPRALASLAALALLSLLVLSACGGQATPAAPAGDAARGEALFTSAGCAGCHSTGADQIVGPGLAGIVNGKGPYGENLPNGKPINDANLIEWLKIGGVGKIGQMPGNNTLTDQELLDLVAYLKTLE